MRLALIAILLSGCAVIADKRVAAGCQLADGVTTKRVLDQGGVERNPLLKDMSGDQVLAFKAVIAAMVLWLMQDYEQMSGTQKVFAGSLTVFGCGVAVHNHGEIR